MKRIIDKKKTPSGPWYVFNGLFAEDLEIEVGSCKYDAFSTSYRGYLAFSLGDRFVDDIRNLVIRDEDDRSSSYLLEEFVRRSLSYYFELRKVHSVEDFDFSIHKVHAKKIVKLKNVRREDTKKKRFEEAEESVKSRLDPNGLWVRDKICELVNGLNTTIQKYVDDKNKSTLEQLEDQLKGSEVWNNYTDARVDPSDLPVYERIAKLEQEQEKLHKKLDKAYGELRKVRAKTFVDGFEAAGWKWKSSGSDELIELPGPYVDKVKELVSKGKAFTTTLPKHRRGILGD